MSGLEFVIASESPGSTSGNTLTVPAGVKLTVPAGGVVKFGPGGSLPVSGSLVADGTAGAPVVFTSFRDDSAGGDSNDDGTASSPAADDWSGIYSNGSATASITLDHVRVSYDDTLVVNGGSESITNSVFDHAWYDAVRIERLAQSPVLTGNTFTADATTVAGTSGWDRHSDWPVWVSSDHLDLAKLSGNTGSGTVPTRWACAGR